MSDTRITPLKSLVGWVGGKRRLAPLIVARIEKIQHDLYAEPFFGMGSVFLARSKKIRREIINDKSFDVINLFRIAKHHPAALLEEMRFTLVARADFARLLTVPPNTLTDVQRAARFLFLQKLSYGGRPYNQSFSSGSHSTRGFNIEKLSSTLRDMQRRLVSVTIENLEWFDCLHRYDRKGALFYLDPPYWGCEGYYGPGLFSIEEHARIAAILRDIHGSFILSINDKPEIRELYGEWAEIDEAPTVYSVGGRQSVHELLISKVR